MVGLNRRAIFLILLLATMALVGARPTLWSNNAQGKLKVAFLDIGQGDSILLTTPHNKHILIDGGPDSTVLTRLGEQLPFRDHTIDLMVASHNHSDHIVGLNAVMARYDVKKMWISGAIHTTNDYLQMIRLINDKKIPTEVVYKGKEADIDGVHLRVIHPADSAWMQRPADQHDATIVIRAQYGQKSFLLTGDLNEGHEANILASGENIAADVLKEPHHGSDTGLLPAFLQAVHPTYAVIQVGKNNTFGHPAPSTLQKLQQAGVKIFRNDLNGTITAVTDGQTLTVRSQK